MPEHFEGSPTLQLFVCSKREITTVGRVIVDIVVTASIKVSKLSFNI
jgi:hypothetical protein